MRESRDVMSDLAQSGLSPEQFALVMELAATVATEARPIRDEGADRRREKDKERQRVRRNLRKSAESADVADTPPPSPSSSFSPTPPKPTLTPSTPPIVPPPSQNSLADEIWAMQPRDGKGHRKATRPDVRTAYAAARKRGGAVEDIRAACQAYYAHPDRLKDEGKYAKGAAVLLQMDRWQDYLPRPEPPAGPVTPEMLAFRQRHFRDTGEWREGWGERPKDQAA